MNKGLLSVLFCYILWGLLPLFWRLLGGVNPVYVLAARVFFSCLTYLVLTVAGGKWPLARAALRSPKRIGQAFVSGVFISLNWGIYIWAVGAGHVIDSSLGYYINPLMVIVLAALVFKEKLTRLEWAAVTLAAIGVGVSVAATGTVPWIALTLAVSFTCYGTVKKVFALDSESALFMETLVMTPLALAYIIWAEINGAGALAVLTGWQYLLLPAAGILTGLPLLWYANGVKTAPYYLVGIVSFVSPTLQFLCGVLTGEPFTPVRAVTFAFIWAGIALVIAGKLRHRAPQEKAA